MSDEVNPLARTFNEKHDQGLLLVRANDRARLVWAYAQGMIDEVSFELSVAMHLRIPATPDITSADLGSSMKPAALAQRRERRAAIKAAADALASACAAARFAREIEKDVGEAMKVPNENETPLDPATEAILRREERDRKARRERFDESRRRAQERLAEERKTPDAPIAGEPEPLPVTP